VEDGVRRFEVELAHGYAVTYPCTGVLTPDSPTAPNPLARLLGPARARVLVLLETPKSTSQLVALTGQGLGSMGGHLKVLLDGALVGRRRAGRSLLYYRTRAGDSLAWRNVHRTRDVPWQNLRLSLHVLLPDIRPSPPLRRCCAAVRHQCLDVQIAHVGQLEPGRRGPRTRQPDHRL
jgi:DNA-binding transcriptional ArsR family regulator